MNLAICIGVSDYTAPVSKLPACKSDVAIVTKLLRNCNKFGDILELHTDTSSPTIKSQVSLFINKYQGHKVGELFFYYTGHGDLYKEEFLFLFSDYSDTKRKQTSLTHSELDSMLRSLNPDLTIKVVDACNAGVTYVKESDALAKHLDSSKGSFKNCYFMFSSRIGQPSFQDRKLSDFTEAFVEACATFPGKEIRYRDIVDHISDRFQHNADQTPVFIIQAPCVEVFCEIREPIRKLLAEDLGNILEATGGCSDVPTSKQTLLDVVRKNANEFCTKKEAEDFFLGLFECLRVAALPGELKDMYSISAEFDDGYSMLNSTRKIGLWLEENGGDFFAKPTYREEHEPGSEYGEYILVINGFESTAEIPFKAIRIAAKPIFENIPHAVGSVTFVISKSECVFFYAFNVALESDWGKLTPPSHCEWAYFTVKMKTDLTGRATAHDIISRYGMFVEQTVREKLKIKPTTPENTEISSASEATPSV